MGAKTESKVAERFEECLRDTIAQAAQDATQYRATSKKYIQGMMDQLLGMQRAMFALVPYTSPLRPVVQALYDRYWQQACETRDRLLQALCEEGA
jgi:hypothetical protein